MAVVVGYVRSAEGRAALRAAVEEARRRECRLVVVHSRIGGTGDPDEEVLAYREDLERLEQQLRDSGVAVEVHERVRGNAPSTDVIDVADEADAQLIVIGLRRRSPVGKLVLGSVAQEILLGSDRPVLTVKAGESDRNPDEGPPSEAAGRA